MAVGFKISKTGYDVLDKGKPCASTLNFDKKDYLISVIAIPFIKGAQIQITRYIEATERFSKDSVEASYRCFYEFSSLIEHLIAVARYSELFGEKHNKHDLWVHIRNHIRHDIRENIHSETHPKKIMRSTELKIDPSLEFDLTFYKNHIKVGEAIITISEIFEFLDWATQIAYQATSVATSKGLIKINSKHYSNT